MRDSARWLVAVACLWHGLVSGLGPNARAQTLAQDPAPPADPVAPQLQAAEPAPSAAAETSVRAELEHLKAEVRELRERAAAAEAAALELQVPEDFENAPLRIYGFVDFGLDKAFLDDREDDGVALLRSTEATTFVFGNLNVYLDARPVDDLHIMVEVRLTLAPHGEEIALGPPLGTSYERIDATAFDFSSPSLQSQLRLGSLYIERAWSEYRVSQLLTVQWGLFLTPFGIWNLDHGSPTLISLMLPTFIASQMVPTRLLGVHLYGTALLGTFELGYAAHVSNGRTPLDVDLTEDKAAGLRLFVARERNRVRWVVGASGYLGRYVDQNKRPSVDGDGNVFDWQTVVDYDEQVLGFDLGVDAWDLRLRSEAVFRWVRYRDGKSELAFNYDGETVYLPNRLEWDWYGLIAYRTPIRIEPYVQLELTEKSFTLPRYAGSARASLTGVTTTVLSFGFNVELTSHTLFKAQLAWIRGRDEVDDLPVADLPVLYVRVVSSF